jgi:predicted TIM-barrel fold metal-dependent hydrolase
VSLSQMISSDSHLIEPPDLWVTRLDPALRDRGPRVMHDGGDQWWSTGGKRGLSFAGGAQTGDRFTKPKELRVGATFDQVRPGGYLPDAHLADSESDGVVGAVLYPTQGLILYTQADPELLSACCRAYNDWLADFCSYAPQRLKGVAMVNLDDIDEAVGEMRRARSIGLVGALIPTAVAADRPYTSPEYEPIWASAVELGMPLSLHLGANRVGSGGYESDLGRIRESYFAVCEQSVKVSLADMIFSGVFDRHPDLRVGSIEHELGWIPFFLDRLDYTYTQRHGNARYYRYRTADRPSDFFRRNVFCSFQDDDLGIRERHTIGIEGLMWGSDYPHTESTFPKSQQIMAQRLRDVAAAEQRMITGGNAARLYGFEPPH